MTSSSLPNGVQLKRICDEDLGKKSHNELSRLVRQLDSENKSIMFDHDNMMKEVNRRLHIHLMEIRGLKNVNQKLQDDNQELRDLCCFLDDERQNGKKMAKDWQRFGRYTASVMRSEVSVYQEKLKELELKQDELIRDNLELQELCLYLGKEHLFDQDHRDDGDGSSSGTVTGCEKADHAIDGTEEQNRQLAISDETLNYIKQLEDKIRKLEEEKTHLAKQLEQHSADRSPSRCSSGPVTSSGCSIPVRAQVVSSHSRPPHCIESVPSHPAAVQQHSSKPEAVVHAMKVLEVHQQLERPVSGAGPDHLGDKEKAIVKEMCNVVWRKLEDSSPSETYRVIPPPSSPETSAKFYQQSSKIHSFPRYSQPPQFPAPTHQKSTHLYSPPPSGHPVHHYQAQQQQQQQQSSPYPAHNFRLNSQSHHHNQNRNKKPNFQNL